MQRFIWLVVLLALMLIAGGCPRRDQAQPPPGGEEIDINALVAQWTESGHANVLLYPAGREGCVVCHDGGAFAEGITDPAALERDFNVAIDCRACHTGRGVDLMEAGTVDIPTRQGVQAGLGAQCLACHNERRAPNIADENRAAPHPSSQAGVFTATGGIRAEGFSYGSTTAHVNIRDTCVGCHMTRTEGNFAGHTFRVENVEAACGRCHQGIRNSNLRAKADYDGDGNVEGFMDEVEGLLNVVRDAVVAALDGGSFTAEGGRLRFRNAAGDEIQVENQVYQAAYNHTLVSQDGSLGIHNPLFAVQLLQQSYRALTGEDVPGAELR